MASLYYPCQDCLEYTPTEYTPTEHAPPIGHPDYEETRGFWTGKVAKATYVDMSEIDYD